MALTIRHQLNALMKHRAWSLTSFAAFKVYIKLLDLVENRGNPLKATNAELCEVTRTATRAIGELVEAGLVEVTLDPTDNSRTIKVK